MTRRNPNDVTFRNVDAVKRRVEKLEAKAKAQAAQIKALLVSVARLGRLKAPRF